MKEDTVVSEDPIGTAWEVEARGGKSVYAIWEEGGCPYFINVSQFFDMLQKTKLLNWQEVYERR